VNRSPGGFSEALLAIQVAMQPGVEVVVVGAPDAEDTQEMIRTIRSVYLPNKVVLLKDPNHAELKKMAPYTESQKMIGGKATVYICRNFACEAPLVDPAEVLKSLRE
jgi:uncharacterized protein